MRHSADNARENSVSGRFWWLTSYGKILVSHTTHFSFGAGHSGRMAQPRALLVAAVVVVVSVCNWYHGNICYEFVHHQKITSPLLCFALKNEINHISPCHIYIWTNPNVWGSFCVNEIKVVRIWMVYLTWICHGRPGESHGRHPHMLGGL